MPDSVFTSLYAASNPDTPSYREVCNSGNERERWYEAINAEIRMLFDRGTFDFVAKPKEANIIDSKLVFKRKRDADGVITRYKARMVARGFRQRTGVDFEDSYASTAKSALWRMILAIATAYRWPQVQMDATGSDGCGRRIFARRFTPRHLHGRTSMDQTIHGKSSR